MVKILVTGGAGFVGSHTLVFLLKRGFQVVVIDNSCNSVKVADGASKPESLLRVETIAEKFLEFEPVDIRDTVGLRGVFKKHGPIDAVIHFGGLKSVGESVRSPLKYYDNNVTGTINLVQIMEEFNCKRIIFSSSSTVYGIPKYLPLDEEHPTGATESPYGRTKYIVEQLFKDLCASDPEWSAVMLRYFNPIGAHPSGKLGEDPPGIPRNLIPALCQIGVGRLDCLKIYGDDYETPDGSCVRGYVHVMDVSSGHVSALDKLLPQQGSEGWKGWRVFNLGMGVGTSVFQILDTFKKVTGLEIPAKVIERRAGDVPATFANCSKAKKEMGWAPVETLETMCMDSWRFQVNNPFGYLKPAPVSSGGDQKEDVGKMNGSEFHKSAINMSKNCIEKNI